MIQANELRIGNFVENRILKETPKYTRILWYDFDGGRTNYFYPIPLTPEILEKCGFVETETNIYVKNSIEIVFNKSENEFYLSINTDEYIISKPFKYLHQLQNLYFSLTGEELYIQL